MSQVEPLLQGYNMELFSCENGLYFGKINPIPQTVQDTDMIFDTVQSDRIKWWVDDEKLCFYSKAPIIKGSALELSL